MTEKMLHIPNLLGFQQAHLWPDSINMSKEWVCSTDSGLSTC